MTTTCDKCDATFTHPTKNQAEQALRLHTIRKHRRFKPVVHRRSTIRSKSDEKQQGGTMKFCPCCGTDLVSLAIAISTVRQMRHQ